MKIYIRYFQFFKYKIGVIVLLVLMTALIGCEKDFKEKFLFTDFMIEFDAATWQSPAPGKDYPILGPYEKASGIYSFNVNLVGAQRDVPTTVKYGIVEEETTAEEGVHFRLLEDREFVIDANSSTSKISIEILDFSAASGTKELVLELLNSEKVKVSNNYKRIGISISLVGPPHQGSPLHNQLGPDNYYNSLYFDILNPSIPFDIINRMEQIASNFASYADGSRTFQTMHLYFGDNNQVTFVSLYQGGGGVGLATTASASWTYELLLNSDGVGRFNFIESNTNGTNLKNIYAPFLDDYIEKYEFKVGWVDNNIAIPPRPGVLIGGLFRTDDPTSFLIGSLESLDNTGSKKPYPQSPKLHEIFDNGVGDYFTTVMVDPDDGSHSLDFINRWSAGKAYIQSLQGRVLYKMMFYFNPNFSFQDIQLIAAYNSSTGGKLLGQSRFTFQMDFEGVINPLGLIYQNANGRVTQAPEIVDNFLMQKKFKITRNAGRIRFTDINDSDVYFEGTLGNLPISTNSFWLN